MEKILEKCACGATPVYFGTNTFGYIECPNCHLRTHNYFDCDKRVEWDVDEFGNKGWFEHKHTPNADILAYGAWLDNEVYKVE